MFSRPGIERAVLSLALRDDNILSQLINENIQAKHFSIKGNSIIYNIILHLKFNLNIEKLDAMLMYSTVKDEKAKESLDELGGIEYIDTLFNSYIVNNLDFYIKELKESYKNREIYSKLLKAKEIIEDNGSIEETVNTLQNEVSDIILEDNETKEYKIGTNLRERMEERKEHPQEVYGYKVGWKRFDKISQGMQDNDLLVICAEPKTGKSTLLTNWAYSLCESGLSGAYFDTEMSDEEFEDRLLSIVSGVVFEEIRNGMCYIDTQNGKAIDKVSQINSAMDIIEKLELYHEYMPDFNIESVTAKAKKYKREKEIDFLMFDYIKLPTNEATKNVKEYEKLGYFTTCLKDLAGVLSIPVITACQTNRNQLGTTEPDASAIGGSFRILQMASKLYFLRNKTDYELQNEGLAYGNQVLHVAYQRHGGTGEKIYIQNDKPILRMSEVS